jgi:glycine dehydrogenase
VSDHPMLADLDTAQPFSRRHIGPGPENRARMLEALGLGSLEERPPPSSRPPESFASSRPATCHASR